jgi:hypothetical protein
VVATSFKKPGLSQDQTLLFTSGILALIAIVVLSITMMTAAHQTGEADPNAKPAASTPPAAGGGGADAE